jgi:tRNA 2-thiouridine synthesizing protein E
MGFDEEGFFGNPHQWNEEATEVLVEESGMKRLDAIHWTILRFLRRYYFQNDPIPPNREIKQWIDISLMEMEAFFPGSVKHAARRLAGLSNPNTWS